MDLKDLFLTPIYLAIFYALAFAVRKRFTNVLTKKYFIPALSVKFLGALSLGIIYQFYYNGGDTFNYYSQIKVVHTAFMDSPSVGLKLIFSPAAYDPTTIKYTGQMYWYNSPTEYFIVRVGAICSLLCFNTYSVIGLLFAISSFSGMWAMYLTFLRIYPLAYKKFVISVFFLPSVFFWGSGLMKDSLCMGALGWIFYAFYHAFIERKHIAAALTMGCTAIYLIISVKVYILLSFMPPALLWVFNENNQRIKSPFLRLSLKPLFLLVGLGAGYLGITNITAGDEKYDIDRISERTQINQTYLTAQAVNGSSYDIGKIDGSPASILRVAPQAIIVTLYRPFLFEAHNPVMLLSALEATLFIYLTASLFYKTGILKSLHLIVTKPILLFSFLFCIIFAIGVGTNSGNFGTLVRYKIPLMPFYLSALYIMQSMTQSQNRPRYRSTDQLNKPRKLA